ncbi:MAG TPA: ATP-binding cassette domain-containing protein [Candidatus Lachnoclostridium stercorigallinarum]|uniref:ATP-binding cassette domain-containing protein n=1 Tax=Candidatus Lachnoclostridium stercorigallinarum TaxID=2838634 RepID=A0A9D2K4W2_9FIRM|nr:ATP-binding cassette domain-containing protein [Candidatus Lachnoclostridium stercorigallinarum]
MAEKTLLQIQDLKMYFENRKGWFGKKIEYVKAVDGVSLEIKQGETVGLVGESGCGKSTTGYSIMRLYKPTSGKIIYDGVDIAGMSEKEVWPYRKRMQMIFQDPYASLDPRMTVADIVGEPLDIYHLCEGKERQERIYELLNTVGLGKEHASRYPHEFSGGQRQRVGIARALAVNPEFVVCDEPISALDVSIQAQVVNMLEDLQAELGLTYLFIAHDLSMVRHISRKVGVMYLGSLVELAETEELYEHTLHPYTKALMSAVPELDPAISKTKKVEMLKGDVPSPIDSPAGCKFATRCPYATERCMAERPLLKDAGGGHLVACHLI